MDDSYHSAGPADEVQHPGDLLKRVESQTLLVEQGVDDAYHGAGPDVLLTRFEPQALLAKQEVDDAYRGAGPAAEIQYHGGLLARFEPSPAKVLLQVSAMADGVDSRVVGNVEC